MSSAVSTPRTTNVSKNTRPSPRSAASSTARSRRPTPAADPRTAILDAAIAILQREGAGALTVRSVATAAGCSTTGVYTWFGGKNGLIESIFVDGFARFGLALDEVLHLPAEQRWVGDLAVAYRTWALANPTHYMVMFAKAVPDFEPSPAALATARGTFTGLVTSMATAIDAGVVAGTPADVAHHVWAGIHGYVALELAGMDMTDPADRDAAFLRGVQRLIRGCAP